MAESKKIRIQKRFEIWVEYEGTGTLEDGLEVAKQMKCEDFVKLKPRCNFVDVTELRGTGVVEEF